MVRWLGLNVSMAGVGVGAKVGALGSIPGWETKIPHPNGDNFLKITTLYFIGKKNMTTNVFIFTS